MPTSELSDALNPNVVRQRNYDNALVYQDQRVHATPHLPNFHYEQPQQQQPHEYVPHRSELELAVVEPTPAQRYAPVSLTHHVVLTICRPRPAPATSAREFLRLWKESDQVEKNRRVAWEREQEAKLTRIQEENEGRLRTMQGEIDSLKECIQHLKSVINVPAAPQTSAPEPTHDSTPFQDLPQDHLSNQNTPHPLFVQGSSTDPAPYQANEILDDLADVDDNLRYTRKRTATPPSGDEGSSDDYGMPLDTPRPNKRINGHDTRLLTIQVRRTISGRPRLLLIVTLFEQHAMRSHLNRLMAVTEDGPLPANHIEGAPLTDDEPVRFIWARTIKQSQHNARMKKRVISDLIRSKELYEHVPQDEFTVESLDPVFDQTFSTLRNRYKAQTDANVAQRRKEKEINKMIKTRRTNRKRAVSPLAMSRNSGLDELTRRPEVGIAQRLSREKRIMFSPCFRRGFPVGVYVFRRVRGRFCFQGSTTAEVERTSTKVGDPSCTGTRLAKLSTCYIVPSPGRSWAERPRPQFDSPSRGQRETEDDRGDKRHEQSWGPRSPSEGHLHVDDQQEVAEACESNSGEFGQSLGRVDR